MGFEEKHIQRSKNPYKEVGSEIKSTRSIFYGEVVSIDDPTDGGRIRAKIQGVDNKIDNNNVPYAFPLLPKFFHILPKVGEMVKVIIEDIQYPERNRFWMGSLISQPHKVEFDSIYTAQATTDMALTKPEPAPSTYPDAKGVFPEKEDIGIVGRVNTDVLLKINEVHIRAGKHESDDIFKLNKKNPASISLVFEPNPETEKYYSSSVILSDKIALISHTGEPKFKAANINSDDRVKIFEQGHPVARGDVLVEALNIIRRAVINHIHGYNSLPADKNTIIRDLENINFEAILQKNIVIN